MKKQWFSIMAATLSATTAAVLLCLVWGACDTVSGTTVAAPLDATPMVPPLADSPPIPPGEVVPADVEAVNNGAAGGWMIECADCPAPPRQSPDMTGRSLRLDASGWHIETVDSEEKVGVHTSLALDGSGYPHISYFDYTNDDLKYAYQGASGWHIKTIDTRLGLLGGHTSLALDGSGYPHISYYDDINDDLKYAYQDASGWHTETVDSAGYVGMYTSLALDGSGYPHISYYNTWNQNLKYAYQDFSGWYSQTVDSVGDVGSFTSLALDEDGYPHISYYDWIFNYDLRYAYQDASGWHIETVDSDGNVGKSTSLALDGSGYPHISYLDDTNDDLKYAYQDASGWYSQTVDSEEDVGSSSSLALNGSGYPHISYYDATNGGLKYAYQDASGWYSQTVDSEEDVGQSSSLALDGDGYPYISYRDYTNHDLKYAYYSTQPVAAFTASPITGDQPLTVVFTDTSTGEITAWDWAFGDGGISSQQNPTHTYTSTGVYTVSLTTSGPDSSDTLTRTNCITVTEPPPVAGFTANPTGGDRPLMVVFTDTSTGAITAWDWTFGDGGVSSQQNPTHTYTSAGVYTVSLTVSGAGGSDTLIRTNYITVTEPPPVPQVDFVGAPRSGDAPLTVQFTSTITGTVTAYGWRFDDDGVADTPNPTHTYASAGSFGVTLVVTGPGGTANVSKPGYITVNAAPGAPTATFSADVVSGTAPLTVTFTAITSGAVEHWLWNFGDGGIAFTGPLVNHTYVTSGTFDVSLTVSNTHGSFIVNEPSYITVRKRGDKSYYIYLPLVMRST